MADLIKKTAKTRRELFEEQLRSLQDDIASLSVRMIAPNESGMPTENFAIHPNTAEIKSTPPRKRSSKNGAIFSLSYHLIFMKIDFNACI